MNEVIVANERLVSSSRAASLTKYSQDYITQLCRTDKLECKMITDQWYVDIDSLRKYMPNIPDTVIHTHDGSQHEHLTGDDEHTLSEKKAYSIKIADVRSGTFKYDGNDYINTQKAAEISGYSQDYIGQLARSGDILARKVGRRWYIARDSLIKHKEEKDAMLQAVQAVASGVEDADDKSADINERTELKIHKNFTLNYFDENNKPLIPNSNSTSQDSGIDNKKLPKSTSTSIKQDNMADDVSKYSASADIDEITTDIKTSSTDTHLSIGIIIVIILSIVLVIFIVALFTLTHLQVDADGLLKPIYTFTNAISTKYGISPPGNVIEYTN